MNREPQISVIMSVYKEPIDWLRQSIDSILGQSYKDFEFIIVCDNPDYREGIALLNEYAKKDNKIKLILNEVNIGLTKSLNKGLAIARGEYIARMDADDVSLMNRFDVEIDYLKKHPDVDVLGSNKRAFGNVGFLTKKTSHDIPLSNEDIKVCMLFVCPMVHPSVMMKRLIGGEPVKYDENNRVAQDYRLWHDLQKHGAVINNINEVLVNYRVSNSQISSKNALQREVCKGIYKELLQELYPDVTEEKLQIHSEVTLSIKTEISLEQKIGYLAELSSLLKKRYCNEKYIDKMIARYVLSTCIAYQQPLHYLKPPGIKKNITDSRFLRAVAKYYIAKIR